MLKMIEIEISYVDKWIDYFQIDGESKGSLYSGNFPDKPELGNRYYLITSYSVVKGIAKKIN